HRAQRRTVRDAQQIRFGERISKQCLQTCTCDREARTDASTEQDTRQPNVEEDRPLTRIRRERRCPLSAKEKRGRECRRKNGKQDDRDLYGTLHLIFFECLRMKVACNGLDP